MQAGKRYAVALAAALALGGGLVAISCGGGGGGGGGGSVVWNPTYTGHRSLYTLTTSNGLSVATYAIRDAQGNPVNALDRFKDHCYSDVDETTPSIDYLFDLYFGYRRNGISSASTWLNAVTASQAEYVNGTNIIHTVQTASDLRFDSYYFIPFHDPAADECDQRFLVALVKVTNTGVDATDCSAFSLLNFHLGGQGSATNETVIPRPASGYVAELRNDVTFIYKNLVGAHASYSADYGGVVPGANNPYQLVAGGQHFADAPGGQQTANDMSVGFENRVNGGGTFASGETMWAGVLVGFSDSPSVGETALYGAMDAWLAGRGPEQILQDEQGWWSAWHVGERVPPGLAAEELAVFRQSTAVLKMGQVREPGKSHGQILASLVPGQWNICWVRDASYALMGLVAAGHYEEAKAGLEFMLGADMRQDTPGVNFYQEQYIESTNTGAPNYGLGVNLTATYTISVVRYYGDGTEESDFTAAGPNIEWDNWGLFLWALGEYVEATGDTAWLTGHWTKVSTQVADLLVELIDPTYDILLPDSSIWERHWVPYGLGGEPDTRKHFTYSSICAYRGLKMAAQMATRVGDAARAATYDQEADRIQGGIRTHLIVRPDPVTGKPALAGNLEEMHLTSPVRYMDLAVVEAINVGVLQPLGSEAEGTLAAFDAHLKIQGSHSPGYFRCDDGTNYDIQEWVVIDLRLVSAFVAAGQRDKAKLVLDWVTDQARWNYNLIGELFDAQNGNYAGAIPMCGFGPGAYILALHAYH